READEGRRSPRPLAGRLRRARHVDDRRAAVAPPPRAMDGEREVRLLRGVREPRLLPREPWRRGPTPGGDRVPPRLVLGGTQERQLEEGRVRERGGARVGIPRVPARELALTTRARAATVARTDSGTRRRPRRRGLRTRSAAGRGTPRSRGPRTAGRRAPSRRR